MTKTLLHASRYASISGTTRGIHVRPAVIKRAIAAGYVVRTVMPDGGTHTMGRCYLCDRWAHVDMLALDHVDPATKPLPGIYLEDIALACTPCNSAKRDHYAGVYPY